MNSGGPWLNRFQIAFDFAALLHQIVVQLQAKKKSFGQAKITGEPQIGVGRNIPLSEYDFINAPGRNMNRPSQRI